MLALFKGELSYTDITRNMSFKEMMALRDARVKRLLDEKKEAEKASKNNGRGEVDFDKLRKQIAATSQYNT